jgi:DNA-binding NarL/FixJ family response regulator
MMFGQRPRRILVVDDHPVVRSGVTALLELRVEQLTTAESEDVTTAIAEVTKGQFDLVVADLFLGGRSGLELVKELRSLRPRMPVLMLSMHRDPLLTQRVLQAGARGYVLKSSPIDVLIHAIQRVLGGDVYVDPAIAGQVLERLMSTNKGEAYFEKLTNRELEIFRLIGEGHESRTIARLLHLSPRTVESHRTNIRAKLGMQGAHELVRAASRWVASMGEGV